MASLDERLAALSPEKRALFERMLAERAQPAVYPLAVLQRGLWFLEQVRPDNPAHVVPGAVRIKGPLDTEVLRRAVAEIVRRHDALRTTFELRDGKPAQLVHPHVTVDIPETDLRGREVSDAEVEKLVAEELARPFDITRKPLLRLTLLRLAEEESVLVVAMHHLISDRWSTGVLLTELSALYEAYSKGEPSPLPDLPVQYGDFAVWQQQRLEREHWADDLAYWRDRLAGAPAAIDLPTDRPRPAVQGFDGGSVPIELSESLTAELSTLAHRHGATPYMVLLAAFTVLLSRYSRSEDVVVGVPVAVRDNVQVEPLIGYFVNTMAIRADLGGDPTFTEVVERVRDACLGAYRHQDVPFDLVVAELNTTRDLSRPPVYQVSFSYGREPVPESALGGAELERLTVRSAGSRFDLEFQAFDNGAGVTGWFDYDSALFDESTIVRMAGHFRNIVRRLVADPDQRIGEVDLLDDAERQRMLVDWNATERSWPDRGLVHECVEAQARHTPDATAVRFLDDSVSYDELNRRANRLARRLRALGAGRDVLVGVAMERSVELVVSLLAVLKAGAAYVPLDPDYPRARLEFMLADSDVRVLLTQRRLVEEIDCLREATAEVLCVDELGSDLADEADDDLGIDVDGEDLAYVIYTSGSTGRPKGVQNVHAGIRNRLLWMQDEYGLDGSDRVLQKTPISFDVSVWEFFWPLMTGATLVLARPGGHRDGAYLAELIQAEGVTTLHFVPAMLQAFLAEPVERCTSLRRVLCSGEELPRDLQDRFLSRSRAELHNLYGPTEAAIDVTAWACRADTADGPVPIGRPIANTEIYVLDAAGRPVPIGVPGELHIGGRNLARGYLNRPELTAEKFVDHPFRPGARLYRTGDLARFRDDGAVEFLGRLDHQIKLRGFRIELGEIEAALARHDRVREAVVATHEYAPGDHRLVAYLVATPGEPPESAELAAHVREWLPEYMVPAAFVVLPAFPLTPSGKVDRKALPAPETDRPELRTSFVAPEGQLEAALAELWREVLGVDQVGVQDNFFDLGGHSLLMAEVRTRLAAELGHSVSMVELFQYPTVRSLAEYLAGRDTARTDSLAAAEQRAEDRRRRSARRRRTADRRTSFRTDT
jgi:amino acid adenylation domain-containing protein